jgi:hypothetical protein
LNRKAVVLQLAVFVTQWGLMIIGFGILSLAIAPLRFLEPNVPLGRYFDAGLKALFALLLSVAWLFIWYGQVRFYFYRRGK